MLWCKPKPQPPSPLMQLVVQTLLEVRQLRKELNMDFTSLNNAIGQLATDVAKEVADAQAAIVAAQGGDPSALAAAVTALNNIDNAVKAADASFQPTGTSTTTVPTPPSV